MVRFLADASLHHAIVTGCARCEPAIDFLVLLLSRPGALPAALTPVQPIVEEV